jgi:hypothetical protein
MCGIRTNVKPLQATKFAFPNQAWQRMEAVLVRLLGVGGVFESAKNFHHICETFI